LFNLFEANFPKIWEPFQNAGHLKGSVLSAHHTKIWSPGRSGAHTFCISVLYNKITGRSVWVLVLWGRKNFVTEANGVLT